MYNVVMRYRLVATDYDNSLCPRGQSVNDFTKNVINKFIARGGRFVIVTGRMNYSIRPIAKDLGLKGEIVSCQGAVIRNIETNEILYNIKINKDLAVEYLRVAESIGLIPQVYNGDNLYTVKENTNILNYGNFCNVKYEFVEGKLSDAVLNDIGDVDMIYLWTSPEDKTKNLELFTKMFEGRLDITSSTAHNIEAVSFGASKGDALKRLAKMYKIPQHKTMAFGDSLNDKSMIETASFGVAMLNSKDGLEKVADYICEDTTNDGVAKTIEKYCLKRSIKWLRKKA